MPNDTFKPKIFTSSQIDDDSNIKNGQFIINLSDGKIYLDHDGVRYQIGGSQNENTDAIFVGSDLLTSINETGFQTNWSPDFSVDTNLSDVLFSVMRRFDGDEFANAVAHLDFVRRLDDLENGNFGGATNITVNGVSPDSGGNIAINAENITFDFKDDIGNDIPTSQCISTDNLQSFFKTVQYAIFSVNGKSPTTNDENTIDGAVTLNGADIYLAGEGTEASNSTDWDGNLLNTKTVYELAADVYSYCPRGIVINDGETATIDGEGIIYISIQAGDILVREGWHEGMQADTKIFLTDTLYDINYLKLGVPEYSEYSVSSDYLPFTENMAAATGWVFVMVKLNGESFRSYVTVNGIKIINIGYAGYNMMERGSFFFPIFEGDTFYIGEEDNERDGIYEIKFIPCYPLYAI